ncbi:MAG: SRPBCC family protein [Thermoanaerobaculales bacterium]
MARKSSAALKSEPPSGGELVLTRVFDAPRRLVFEMWTNPAHVARWWGPRGFSNPVCELDARPGGEIRIDMRGPDGTVYPMTGIFEEVIEPERIVFTSAALHEQRRLVFEVRDTVTLVERGGKTTQTMRAHVVWKTDEADRYLGGMEQGWSESLDRLRACLKDARDQATPAGGSEISPRGGTGTREIVVSRVFDAPRELVWKAWTEPAHVVSWWGPRGFTTTIEEMDVRPGGVWAQVMHGPDGAHYPNKSVFKEVVRPERIVFSHGGGRQGGPGTRFESTWSLTALGEQTRVTIHMVFPSAAEREKVAKEFNAIEGGRQTLERLAEHLPTMRTSAR